MVDKSTRGPHSLAGSTALITGGAGAIASAIATALAERGASLCLFDQADASETAAAVRSAAADVISVSGDVTDESDVARAFEEAEARCGPVDVVVNAAAIATPVRPIIDARSGEWERIIAVNLIGTMLCVREAFRRMFPRGEGTIVNISSNVGKRGMPNMGPYVASKWGVIGLTQTAALEAVEHGIRVNAVCPGPSPSALLDRVMDEYGALDGRSGDDIAEWWRLESPMKRFVDNAEVAHIVAFLASNASSAMTGQALNATCGVVMH